jgi:hypothetical protein
MSDERLILFGILAVGGLSYCLWKTQADWRERGFSLAVVWGIIASLNGFLILAFWFAASVFKRL